MYTVLFITCGCPNKLTERTFCLNKLSIHKFIFDTGFIFCFEVQKYLKDPIAIDLFCVNKLFENLDETVSYFEQV